MGATIAGSNVREPYGDRPGHQVVSDEEFKALLRDFAKPEIREQIANATYRGPGFVLYDEQGYDRELAKQSVGTGWAALVDRVFDTKPANIRIVQVKEKFAGLRVYTREYDKAFQQFLYSIEDESFKICERCGEPGKVRKGGWILTLCDEHAEGSRPLEEGEDT